MQIIELPSGSVEQRGDGILVFRPRAFVELSADDIRQYLSEAQRLAGGPAYAIVDRRAGYSLSFEAQEVLRKELSDFLAAIAYVAKPALGYSVALLTVEQIDRLVPARAFVEEEEALAWLLSQRG